MWSFTSSRTSLNSSVVDGSQDCLFAPISTAIDPRKGRPLEARRSFRVPVANELTVIPVMFQEKASAST